MEEIGKTAGLKFQLVVTGMHLSRKFGSTYREIEKDGFHIDKKVNIKIAGDTSEAVAGSTGLAVSGMAEAYKELDPDIVVLLGDRFEIFGAAAAALISRKIIAHIHGGEITEGAIDDALRHSITKMSYLHFTSTEEYRKRVIQLGEEPERVYNVGALGVDNIKKMNLLSKKELEKELGITFGDKNIIVTFHPVTMQSDAGVSEFKNLLKVLEQMKDIKVIFTRANADPGGAQINKIIDGYLRINKNKAVAFDSMGSLNYLSAMQYVQAVVGNSSSGIIEAPNFGIPTVNIGIRQKGRIRPSSVKDSDGSYKSLKNIMKDIYSENPGIGCSRKNNPYKRGGAGAAVRIVKVLKRTDLSSSLKHFVDLQFGMEKYV
jgi:UDP-hydrolysing UDP-N-acetyl-D-glucosamine 2-epimerase